MATPRLKSGCGRPRATTAPSNDSELVRVSCPSREDRSGSLASMAMAWSSCWVPKAPAASTTCWERNSAPPAPGPRPPGGDRAHLPAPFGDGLNGPGRGQGHDHRSRPLRQVQVVGRAGCSWPRAGSRSCTPHTAGRTDGTGRPRRSTGRPAARRAGCPGARTPPRQTPSGSCPPRPFRPPPPAWPGRPGS